MCGISGMAPTKLIYFDVTALGEPIRYILHYSGTEFEDERLTSELFAPRKPSMCDALPFVLGLLDSEAFILFYIIIILCYSIKDAMQLYLRHMNLRNLPLLTQLISQQTHNVFRKCKVHV
jgi:hypothetical protein